MGDRVGEGGGGRGEQGGRGEERVPERRKAAPYTQRWGGRSSQSHTLPSGAIDVGSMWVLGFVGGARGGGWRGEGGLMQEGGGGEGSARGEGEGRRRKGGGGGGKE